VIGDSIATPVENGPKPQPSCVADRQSIGEQDGQAGVQCPVAEKCM
jgi:hypothetical protein